MSIISGTDKGRIYLYGLRERKLVKATGEYQKNCGIIGIDWVDYLSSTAIHASRKGDVIISSLYDELKTTGETVFETSGCIGLQKHENSVVVGHRDLGIKLLSLKYDEDDEMHTISKQSQILTDHSISKLDGIMLDGTSSMKLACLCEDKPPVVKQNLQGCLT